MIKLKDEVFYLNSIDMSQIFGMVEILDMTQSTFVLGHTVDRTINQES